MSDLHIADWSEVLMSDAISEIQTGVSVNSENRRRGASEIGILKTSCISRGQFFPEEHKAVLAGEVERVKTPLKAGSILMSRMNTPNLVGEVGYVHHQHPEIYLPDRLWMFSGKEGTSDTLYLSHFLSSDGFRQKLSDIATGTSGSMKNIPQRSFLQIPIQLPPLPEQKKIAEILSGIDREIELLAKAIDSHRTSRNALMESIFKDGHKKGDNGSSEWRVWTIDELLARSATPMRSGPFGSALLKEELAQEGIPFLGIDNVHTEAFVPTFKRFLTVEKFQKLRRYEVFPQDVMITIMGTVGRSCIVPNGMGQCVSSKHTWTMTFDHSKVAPQVICWQLNHYSRTRAKFLESSQGGVMDAISSQTLREIEVPIPTSRVFAEQIVEHYKSSHNHEQTLNKKFHKMKLLKNAVASDLLSGRKRVSV